MKKTAVFGSAFNPPTLGHKSVVESLAHFDQVLLLPSYAHAWGKQMLDFELRCQMVNEFIQDLAQDNLELCRVEEALYTPGESVTTWRVMSHLQQMYPGSELTFVIGPDNFFKFADFYRAHDIAERWSVIACPEKVKVRSTMIREKLAKGERVDEFTTPSVARFLAEHSLYSEK